MSRTKVQPYRPRVRRDMDGNCGRCHGPVEDWRCNAALCLKCSRYRSGKKRGGARKSDKPRVGSDERNASNMVQALVPLPHDDYASGHEPVRESSVDDQRVILRWLLAK